MQIINSDLQHDNSDARSEQLQSLTSSKHEDEEAVHGQEGHQASSTAGNNGGRRGNQRTRIRRQDVRFMKRGPRDGAARKMQDNRSELPLAANDASWQRFQTVEQRSEQMNSIS